MDSIVGHGRNNGSWPAIVISGIVAGSIINSIEWIAHRVWLDAGWNEAFAALGKVPAFWTVFVVANFGVGLISVWSYRWLAAIYGRGTATALKVSAAMWVIFWIIPIAGLQPFDIFPNYLLALVIIVGMIDAGLGILPAIRLFDRIAHR